MKDKLLPILLGGFIATAVLGIFGYLFVYEPYSTKKAEADKLEQDVEAKGNKADQVEKDKNKFAAYKSKSLPPEPTVATREYEAVLSSMLRKAGFPSNFAISLKSSTDKTTIPPINPSAVKKEWKYAYNKISYDITAQNVDMKAIANFLEAYYKLDLLHSITKFNIRKPDNSSETGSSKKDLNNRKDLTVTITTEALILDGAEPRQSLLPLPKEFVKVGGVLGYAAADLTPEFGRAYALSKVSSTLASNPKDPPRDYLAMLAKDPFHGSIPVKPPAPPPPPPPPPVVLPSIEQFIRISGRTVRAEEGTATIDITDMANQLEYRVQMTRKGEKMSVHVDKLRKGEDKKPAKSDWWDDKPFNISDRTSSTNRNFMVLGFSPEGDGLLLSSFDDPLATPKAGDAKTQGNTGGVRPGGGFGTKSKTTLPPPSPAAAVGGGLIAANPSAPKMERFYVWRFGRTLKEIVELKNDEVETAKTKALLPLMPPEKTSSTDTGRE